MNAIRPCVLSGSWYPAEPVALTRLVDGFLDADRPADRPEGRPLIGLAPHAGYVYSGPVAGRLYGVLRGSPPTRLMILAPSHRVPLERPALSGAAAFATPLGAVPVDTGAVARLAASGAFVIDDDAHRDEHAIEIQLPMVQRCWPARGPTIVPILVPHLRGEQRRAAAAALAASMDDRTLLLVSTDLTHYGRAFGFAPFSDDIRGRIEELDTGALLRVLAGDAAALLDYGRRSGITMCGLEAAALALETGLPPGHEGTLLGYARSGDRDGDYTRSVSYAAALLTTGAAFPAGSDR